MTGRHWLAVGLVVSVCCGIQANYISQGLHPRFEHRPESVAKELAVVRGESYEIDGRTTYWPEFQNRVAFGLVLTAVDRLGMLRTTQWYILLRFVFAVAAFMAFWVLVWRVAGAGVETAAAACVLLAVVLSLHFNHGWEHPSDFLDPIVFCGFLWAIVRRRLGWLALLAVLAALNRESTVFAGLLWFCAYGVTLHRRDGGIPRLRVSVRDSIAGVAIMAIGYASVMGFRFLFGGARALSQMQHSSVSYWGGMIRDLLADASPTSWIVLLFAIVALPLTWIAMNRRWLTELDLGLLIGALGIFGISAVFSLLPELRMLIPMSVVLIFVAAAADGRRRADANLATDRFA